MHCRLRFSPRRVRPPSSPPFLPHPTDPGDKGPLSASPHGSLGTPTNSPFSSPHIAVDDPMACVERGEQGSSRIPSPLLTADAEAHCTRLSDDEEGGGQEAEDWRGIGPISRV
jgi:hypothetical protein